MNTRPHEHHPLDRSTSSREVPPPAREVVGWGAAGAAWAAPDARGVSFAIAQCLHEAGVREAFGILGGGIAPFAAGLAHSAIRFFHFRHEAGAGFAAIEAFHETRRPGVVVVTTGPGIFNVLNAAMAARVDGAKLLVISGFTARPQVSRGAVQETSLQSMPSELTRAGSIFHDVAIPESEDELMVALARIVRGLGGAGPYVAHLGLPLSLQTRVAERPIVFPVTPWRLTPPAPTRAALDDVLEALLDPNAVLWLGSGALAAHASARTFAEAAGLPVVSSPRAKGVFPESHPLFVGVSGAGGSARVREWFATRRPRAALVVGSRLGEVTSFLAPGMSPTERWMHVDTDPTAFGAAYPGVGGAGIVADAKEFFDGLRRRAEETGWYARRAPLSLSAVAAATPEQIAPRRADVRPPYLLQRIQHFIVEGSDALIMSEAGTSFTWCNAHLRFSDPGRYRTSAAWGSMGHFTTGCVGAALAGSRRVVAVVGDGAMLMNNEINTAVQYDADVLWIVLNDAQLGLNQHGMTALGMRPVETQMPRTDFVAFAVAQGARARAVHTELELDDALAEALSARGPFLLDIRVDATVPSPIVAERIRSLQRQAGGAAEAP
jgi:acetolactate synthase-1/2/3 large subunit